MLYLDLVTWCINVKIEPYTFLSVFPIYKLYLNLKKFNPFQCYESHQYFNCQEVRIPEKWNVEIR